MSPPVATKHRPLLTPRIIPAALAWILVLILFRRGLEAFPIDDAYIHLSYATNFGRFGVLGLTPHSLSLGTTSLLWTLLLSPVGYFELPPFLYGTILTGISYLLLCLASLALMQTLLEKLNRPDSGTISPSVWASLLIATHGNILCFASGGM